MPPRDGDGTVARESLQVCDRWKEQSAAAVRIRRYPGVKHGELLSDEEAFGDILEAAGELGRSAEAAGWGAEEA